MEQTIIQTRSSKGRTETPTEWSQTLSDLYNKTTHLATTPVQDFQIKTDALMTILCIDGTLHVPVELSAHGVLATTKAGETVYVCATKSSLLKIVTPLLTRRPLLITNATIYDINEMIYAAMALKLPSLDVAEQTAKWMFDHPSERLDGVAETWVVNTLLREKKEVAYQIRDNLIVPQNTQNVFSSMLLDNGLTDVACSPENMGVIAGFCAENALREGGKWFKELQRLYVAGGRNKEYILPLFVVAWRVCSDESGQNGFIESGCLSELVGLTIKNDREDIVLTYLEIITSLLQREENVPALEKAKAIEVTMEIMKKQVTMKLIEISALRAMSLYCGTMGTNNEFVKNKWLNVVKYVMELYIQDESVQNVGLNILIKLVSDTTSWRAFEEAKIVDYLMNVLEKNKKCPNVITLTLQVLHETLKIGSKELIVKSFNLIKEISKQYEKEGVICGGCLYIVGFIFKFRESRLYKTKENIKWFLEIGMKYIMIEIVQDAVLNIMETLLKEEKLGDDNKVLFAVLVSSLFSQVEREEEKRRVLQIITWLLQERVDNELLGFDMFNKIYTQMITIKEETVIEMSLECIDVYYSLNKEFFLSENFCGKIEEWMDGVVTITNKHPTPGMTSHAISLLKSYIEETRKIEHFENQAWCGLLYTSIMKNPNNIETIKNSLELRLLLNIDQTIFTNTQIIDIIPLINTVVSNTTDSKFKEDVLSCGVLFLSPFFENSFSIAFLMREIGFVQNCLSQTNQDILTQFKLSMFNALFTARILSNSYPVFDIFSLSLWDINSTVQSAQNVQQIMRKSMSISMLSSSLKQIPSAKTIFLEIIALLVLNAKNYEAFQNNVYFINQCLTSKTSSVDEKRNAMMIYAMVCFDVIKKEENNTKMGVNAILALMGEKNFPEDCIFIGLCAIYNISGFSLFKPILMETKNKVLLGALMEKYLECKTIVTDITKRSKEAKNCNGFIV